MMKNVFLAVARQQQRRVIANAATRGFISVASSKKFFQSWWVPESREFDIAHDCVRRDCLDKKVTVTAATVDPVTDKGIVRNTATQQVEEPHVVVETQNWWPHETRGFDIDHDVASTTKGNKDA